MKFSKEDILHIAKLARLHLKEEEVEQYQKDLGSVLTYVEKLQELDTKEVPEFQHAAGGENVFRTDEIEGCSEATHTSLIEGFTFKEGDLMKVQAIFEHRDE